MISTKELESSKRMILKSVEAIDQINFDTPDGRAVYSNLLIEFGIISKILDHAKMCMENGFLTISVYNEVAEEFAKLGELLQNKVTLFIDGVKA